MMTTLSKKTNNNNYNYSKDCDSMVYRGDNVNHIRTLFHMISIFIKVDDIATFILDDNQKISGFYDLHQTIFDKDFFVYYHAYLKEAENPIQLINEYFNTKNYIAICSLVNEQEVVGYIVFKRVEKAFNIDEINIMTQCSHVYSQYCLDINQYKNTNFEKSIYHTMINNIDSNVYVTDPYTYEVLFMNEAMKKIYNIENPVGKKCWELFKCGRDKPCDECPVPRLLESPTDSYTWEESSDYNQKNYLNHDCLIEWFDHSLVHFQHSVDITHLKEITFDASYDELTGIFNRKTGKRMLKSQLNLAADNNKETIVCLLDVNDLKKINDSFNHSKGDEALRLISSHVKKHMKENDVFFRLSGDEFIASFYDYSYSEVNSIMRSILKDLRQYALKKKLEYDLSFCYGLYIVDNSYNLTVNEIISNADEKMYEWKKKAHLRNAQKELKNKQPIGEVFDYNEKLLYSALSKSTDDYIFICNMKTGVFKYTPNMVEEFNFPAQVLHNAAAIFGAKIHMADKYEFLNANQQITDGKSDSHIVEYRALNKDNEYVWLRCRGHVEYDENNEAAIFAGFISNLGRKNYRDILTGLYNRFEFEKVTNQNIDEEYTVILININDFKSINNLYNREFGDNVLRIIGQNLQTILANKATVYKLDGDEFAILTKETSIKKIKSLYNEILSYINENHTYDDKSYILSITAGVAQAPKDGNSYLDIQRSCEIALQFGKHNTRDKLTFYSEKINTKRTYQVQLVNTLKQCIQNNFENFFLVYQPIIDIKNHYICKIEALCRWKVPMFVDIGPDRFIPLLEDTGDIIELGYWIFEEAISHLKKCLETKPDLSISINVSYIQLSEGQFVNKIMNIINKYDVPYQNIIIELTETSIAKNSQFIIKAINQLRSLGIKIAMDDFGTGYSSLALLKDEPLDIVKIDQSFVKGIESNSFNRTFVKLIIELCHQLHLAVLIEGVETKAELDELLLLDPDYIQGYYFSKPLLEEEHIKSLQNQEVTL